MDDSEIQALVNAAMDQALENKYDETFDDPLAVAVDMVDNDADIFDMVQEELDGDEEQLIPYIEVWQNEHQQDDV